MTSNSFAATCSDLRLSVLDMEAYFSQSEELLPLPSLRQAHFRALLSGEIQSWSIRLPAEIDAGLRVTTRCERPEREACIPARAHFKHQDWRLMRRCRRDVPPTCLGGRQLLLGQILIANGHITQVQLEAALLYQMLSGRALGVELVAAGFARRAQIEVGLLIQRRQIAHVLLGAVAQLVWAPA